MTDRRIVALLKNLSQWVNPFSGLVSHIHMKQTDDGHILAKFSADDNSINFTLTTADEIPFEGKRGCFGNLSYLNQLMTSGFIKSDTEVEFKTRERNGKDFLSTLIFRPNDRMELTYVATDPFRSSLTPPGKNKADRWPVALMLDKEALKEITEYKKIHSAAPNSGKEDVIEICFNDGSVVLEFGSTDSHTSSLSLDAEVEADTKSSFSMYVLSDHFIKALQQSQDENSNILVQLSPDKAMKTILETPLGLHELILAGRRPRDD